MEGNTRVAIASIRRWAIVAVAITVTGCGGSGSPSVEPSSANSGVMSAAVAQLPPFNFEIPTLSNRADLISDGDALVEVRVPKNVPMNKVTLTLNGADVRSPFVADDAARIFRGVLTAWSSAKTCSSPTPTARAAAGPGPA